MKTSNQHHTCKHPSKLDTTPEVKFLCHQSQESVLYLVQSWWNYPKEAYGIIQAILMLVDEAFSESKEFAKDLRFLRELLLTKNLMRHQPEQIGDQK